MLQEFGGLWDLQNIEAEGYTKCVHQVEEL